MDSLNLSDAWEPICNLRSIRLIVGGFRYSVVDCMRRLSPSFETLDYPAPSKNNSFTFENLCLFLALDKVFFVILRTANGHANLDTSALLEISRFFEDDLDVCRLLDV